MAQPTLHDIQANGLRFAYFEEGRGPLVLLLHGFPDTPRTWDAARPALAAAGFRPVTPFMRGYAPTEIPAEEAYDADTLGRDALALIAALGEDKAFLVGHDVALLEESQMTTPHRREPRRPSPPGKRRPA